MTRFLDHYFRDNTFYMPIDLDLCSINETGELEIGIPLKYLPYLIEYDVIRLSRNGKTFKSLQEAYNHYDDLVIVGFSEDKELDPEKLRTKVKDPETGVERDFEVAAGNVKIGSDTVLLNMSTATNCMSAILGTCKLGPNGQCYALRFEKQWSLARQKNIRHEKQWACMTPLAIAQGIKQISEVLPAIKYVRVNEAGELRNLPTNPELLSKVSDEKKTQLADVDDVGKLKDVGAELLKMGSELILYTYTHRSDLDIGDLGPNICTNGSGFMLDNAFIPLKLEEFNRVLDMVDKKELKEFNGKPVSRGVRCMGDCRKCSYCKKKEGKHIFLAIHGSGTPYQLEMEKIVTSVVNTPEFQNLYAAEGNPKEKGEQALQLVPDEMKKMFVRLVPIRQDRVDLFAAIFKSQGNKELLIKALEKYAARSNIEGGKVEVDISNEDANEALAKSIDALIGKFVGQMEKARAAGQVTAEKHKWPDLINALNKAIEMAKKGEKPIVTKALGTYHAGVFGRLKKELGK